LTHFRLARQPALAKTAIFPAKTSAEVDVNAEIGLCRQPGIDLARQRGYGGRDVPLDPH
jgi:hypothetical protein